MFVKSLWEKLPLSGERKKFLLFLVCFSWMPFYFAGNDTLYKVLELLPEAEVFDYYYGPSYVDAIRGWFGYFIALLVAFLISYTGSKKVKKNKKEVALIFVYFLLSAFVISVDLLNFEPRNARDYIFILHLYLQNSSTWLVLYACMVGLFYFLQRSNEKWKKLYIEFLYFFLVHLTFVLPFVVLILFFLITGNVEDLDIYGG